MNIRKLIYTLFVFIPTLRKHPLWRDKKNIPLLRFIRLQLIFFLGEKEIFFKWVEDLILPIKQGDHSLTGNYYFGLWEFEDMAFAIHLLNKEDTFIDIGANLGSYSLLVSGLCKSKTIAYEPAINTFERLSENININQLDKKISPKRIVLTSKELCKNDKKVLFSSDRDCVNTIVNKNYSGKKNTFFHQLLMKS